MTRNLAPPGTAASVPALDAVLGDCHALIVGGTRRGKTGLVKLMGRKLLAAGIGITIVDPHGAYARDMRDWMANPLNRQLQRIVHLIDPASDTAIGLNPLQPYDDSWEACHDAALTLGAVIESQFGAAPEQTPLLARLAYVVGFVCARHKLTLLEALELLSLGGDELRRTLLEDFGNRVVARELEDLQTLAQRSPRDFLNLVQSLKNRLVRALADRRLARILGQRRGLDPRTVMDGSHVVLADLSALAYADAALLGTIINVMFFDAAKRRPPLKSPLHRLMIDEAESMLTTIVARGVDQTAKFGLLYTFSVQRLGQLRARDDLIADALLTNCTWIAAFGGLEPKSARYMVEHLCAGDIDLEEWKRATRPTAVGNEKIILRGTSRARHRARSSAEATSHSRSHGVMQSTSEMSAFASGSALSHAASAGTSHFPDSGLFLPPTTISTNTGRSHAAAFSTSASHAHGATRAQHDTEANATSISRGIADGQSIAHSETESFVTRYRDLPVAMFTLEEQLFRRAAELATLPRRECIVRFEDRAPVRLRTQDLAPAFRSAAFRDAALPLFIARANRTSAYARPAAEVDAEIAAAMAELSRPQQGPDEDFAAAEPATPIDNPQAYAAQFHARKKSRGDEDAPTPFQVIPGGKTQDVDNEP